MNIKDINRFLEIMPFPIQLSAKRKRGGLISGYIDNQEDFIREITKLNENEEIEGIYASMWKLVIEKPLDNMVISRESATKEKEVSAVLYLQLDFDPTTKGDDSSSRRCYEEAIKCKGFLNLEHFTTPLIVNSGYGTHLYYRMDIPQSPVNKNTIENFLLFLKERFPSIDLNFSFVKNFKVPGCISRKKEGERQTSFMTPNFIPEENNFSIISLVLDKYNGWCKSPKVTNYDYTLNEKEQNASVKWMSKFFEKHSIIVYDYNISSDGVHKWFVDCPFKQHSFTGTSKTAVFVYPNGAKHFKCFSSDCLEHKWADYKKFYEKDDAGHKNNPFANYRDITADFLADKKYVKAEGRILEYKNNYWTEVLEKDLDTTIRKWLGAQNIVYISQNVKEIINEIPAQIKIYDQSISLPIYVPDKSLNNSLIAFKNGLLNINSMELLPHTEDFISTIKVLPYNFNPAAKCPRWEQFLQEVFPGEYIQQASLLQEWIGYCISNDTKFQKFAVFIGVQRAGKGIISDVIEKLCGIDNCCGFDVKTLSSDFGRYSLVGKKFGSCNEMDGLKDKKEFIDAVKTITGNGSISIDRKFKDVLSLKLPTRLLFSTNEYPNLKETSAVLVGRMLPFSFTVSWLGREDFELDKKLEGEIEGICMWALAGLERIRKNNRFSVPDVVERKKSEMAAEMSPVLGFIADKLFVSRKLNTSALLNTTRIIDKNCSIDSQELYKLYVRYHHENDIVGEPSNLVWLGRNIRLLIPGIFYDKKQKVYKGICGSENEKCGSGFEFGD